MKEVPVYHGQVLFYDLLDTHNKRLYKRKYSIPDMFNTILWTLRRRQVLPCRECSSPIIVPEKYPPDLPNILFEDYLGRPFPIDPATFWLLYDPF